jgi:hypothetical protein
VREWGFIISKTPSGWALFFFFLVNCMINLIIRHICTRAHVTSHVLFFGMFIQR